MTLSTLLRLAGWGPWRSFERAAANAESTQRKLGERILRKCAHGSYWKQRWGSAGAPPLAECPLTEYSDYADAFQTAFETSRRSPLTGEPITLWVNSSGTTTGRPKRFPMTSDQERQARHLFLAFAASLSRQISLPLKPLLSLANINQESPSPAGVPVGWLTGRMTTKAPRLVAVPPAIIERADLWDEWGGLYTVATDRSLAIVPFPGLLVKLREDLLASIDGYWPYLEGRKDPPKPLPPVRLPAERLRQLRSAFGGSPPGLRQIWPSLAAATCWTTGSASAPLVELEPWRQGVEIFDGFFSSTETGGINVPLYDGMEGHPLHAGMQVIELLPEHADPEPGNVIPAAQAEAGRRYELIVTTRPGLVRYRMHDIVTCNGFHRRSPRLSFSSKSAFYLQLLSVAFPEDLLVKALIEAGYTLRDDLMVGPHQSGLAMAIYVREDSAHPRDGGSAFDRALQAMSPAYTAIRNAHGIREPETIVVPASHPMWARMSHAQAKARYVIPTVPEGLPERSA